MILVTGGECFIGSNIVLDWLAQSDEAIINFAVLTYAEMKRKSVETFEIGIRNTVLWYLNAEQLEKLAQPLAESYGQ